MLQKQQCHLQMMSNSCLKSCETPGGRTDFNRDDGPESSTGEDEMRIAFHSIPVMARDLTARQADAEGWGTRLVAWCKCGVINAFVLRSHLAGR